MSGAEVIVLVGVISSIISIVDGTKQVYDAATNAQGLPEAFRDVAGRLPIVRNILGSAKQRIDNGDIDEDSCKGVKHVVEACEKKAKKIDELFHKAIPADGVSDLKRYYMAVKAYGKGNEVENLMKGMLEDVQLLACEHGMKTATKAQQEQIAQAITEVSAIHPDRPETPLTPSFTIPFRRDPDFIVRQTLLDQLHKKCTASAARTAVVGLGGVGYVKRT
jgi:N-terminal domain on NACHT_NTPase and P-loop NTPases